jgi:hypothetical protein
MIYLITKLWLFLAIAFLIGLYVGWSTCRIRAE